MQEDVFHRTSALSNVVLEVLCTKEPGYWRDDLQFKYVNAVIDTSISMALRMSLFASKIKTYWLPVFSRYFSLCFSLLSITWG